ncbi:MAG TPA: hypothetical protein VF337_04810 [Candidatus Limnocylindrales bacterium]
MQRVRSLLGTLHRAALRPLGRIGGDLLGLVPALIAGAGVFLIVAGLFYYLQPVSAAPGASPSASPTAMTLATFPGRVSLAPDASSSSGPAAIATRIRIRAIVPPIDLAVVAPPPNEEFVLCNVAEYMTIDPTKPLAYPGMERATFLYAHARANMFLPLLDAVRSDKVASLMGLWVEVYTADNQDHVYQITEVIPHISDSSMIDRASSATSDQLWLQTSEGAYGTPGRMYVVAQPIGVLAASPADSHPAANGIVCPGNSTPVCKSKDGGGCRPA